MAGRKPFTRYTLGATLRGMLTWFRRSRPHNPTVFGKILRGEIPKAFIYEDELVVAFENIDPLAEVSILLIPRMWIQSMKEVNASHTALLGHMLVVAAEIARKDERLIDGDFRISINNGVSAGQTVQHLHVHILGGEPLGRSCTTTKTKAMDERDAEQRTTPGYLPGDRA